METINMSVKTDVWKQLPNELQRDLENTYSQGYVALDVCWFALQAWNLVSGIWRISAFMFDLRLL